MSEALKITVTAQPMLDEVARQYNLTPREVQQVGSAAINRTLTTVRASVARRLADAINLRSRDIKAGMSVHKANFESLAGDVTVSRTPVNLIDFIGTRQTKTGVSVLVRKGDARQVLAGTFIATMRSGHVNVFERGNKLPGEGPNAAAELIRSGKHGRVAGDERYYIIPGRDYRSASRFIIVKRLGLTLTGYLSHAPTVVSEEQAKAGETLGKNILSQLSRRLAQRGSGGEK
jgi:hypothetical protein